MASLWNKLTVSGKTTSTLDPSASKRDGKRSFSISVRSRKGLSSIFNIHEDSTDKENDPVAVPELKCEEASHYPVYDSRNPVHNTACPSPRRGLKEQGSKTKLSLRSKSPSPSRLMTSSRKALTELANSVRGRAKSLSTRPSTPTELLQGACPLGRDSSKSVKSKKSVHWRSTDSTAVSNGEALHRSSTKDVEAPMSLPDVGYSGHFLGSKVILTVRPPLTPVLAALDQVDQRLQSIELQRPELAETQQDLSTPIPGTNLPLEDPFDDSADISDNEVESTETAEGAIKEHQKPIKANPDIQVLVGVHPSSVTFQAVTDCIEGRLASPNSSITKVLEDDNTTSGQVDAGICALTRVQGRPPSLRILGDLSTEDVSTNNLPKIECITVAESNSQTAAFIGKLQATSDVGSSVTFEVAVDSADKEDNCHECDEHPTVARAEVDHEPLNYDYGCRVPSLTDPIKHEISSPNVTPRQPQAARIMTAKKLPPFSLYANVTSAAPPRDTTVSQHSGSSDEQPMMKIVHEIEHCSPEMKDMSAAKNEHTRSPSPVCIPLPML